MLRQFIEFLEKANLEVDEIAYFMMDAEDHIENVKRYNLPLNTPEKYYSDAETQYCLVNYAVEAWKKTAKTGMEKIINTLK